MKEMESPSHSRSLKDLLSHSLALILLLVFAYFCYSLGFNSPFLFDDIPNLDALAQIHGSSLLSPNFWEFVFSGHSGPTGRPLSLVTFALQAENWPENPAAFKRINFLIHAFSASLIYIFCHQICRLLAVKREQRLFFCLFITAIWLLHPIHSSTVLYTVQRMALLSNAFMLLGIVIHIHLRLTAKPDKPYQLILLASLSLAITGILALLSKENAPSLVLYLLTLEYTLLRSCSCTRIFKIWRSVFLWLPSLLLIALSLIFWSYLNQRFEDSFDYTMLERVLTQSRVLWTYLQIIALPSVSGSGLFHSITISESLFSPFSTFLSLICWAVLVLLAIKTRKRQPLIAFAVFWYLAGHAIESSILALEIFFNHRNYLAFLGPLIALTYYFINLNSSQPDKLYKFQWAIAVFLIALLGFQLSSISSMWNNPLELATFWYLTEPDTSRNKEFYAIQQATNAGSEGVLTAASTYDQLIADNPGKFRLVLSRMTINCLSPAVPVLSDAFIQQQFERRNSEIERDILSPLQQLINLRVSNDCTAYTPATLGTLLSNFHAMASPKRQGALEYEMAQLQLYLGNRLQAEGFFESAYDKTSDPGILFTYLIHLINQSEYESALERINEAERQLGIANDITTGTRSSKLEMLAGMKKDVEQLME